MLEHSHDQREHLVQLDVTVGVMLELLQLLHLQMRLLLLLC